MISQDVLIKVRAETDQAERKLGGLKRSTDTTTSAMAKLGSTMGSAFSKGIDSLGKMNQAIEGGTKFINFATKGLEAYAKTSSEAAEVVKKLKATTTEAFDGVMASVGKTIVQLEPLISGFASLVNVLNEIGVAGPVAIGAMAAAITGNPAVGAFVGLTAWAAGGDAGAGGLLKRGSIGGYGVDVNKQRRDAGARAAANNGWGTDEQGEMLFLGDVSVASVGGKKPRGGSGMKRDPSIPGYYQNFQPARDAFSELSSEFEIARMVSDVDAGKYQSVAESLRALGVEIATVQDNMSQVDRFSATDSWLARTFGTIEEFDVYKEAFSALTTVATSAFDAWVDGSMGVGEAVKQATAGILKSLAIEAGINALKALAMAASYASTPGMQFWVPGSLKSAAAWGAVAVAAGAGAKGLGGSGGGPGGATPSAPRMVSTNPQAPQGTAAVIVYGDQFAEDSPHDRQLKAKRMVDRALGGRQAVRAA